jgi:RNA polymerase sigma factor (sigma-70 family)
VEPVLDIGECVGMSPDDAAVLGSAVSDADSFEAIFDRYHLTVWGYLFRAAGRERADDLTGQVFVVAFERRATFDRLRGEMPVWLIGIARNLLKTRLRSEARGWRAVARLGNRRDVVPDLAQDVADRDQLNSQTRAVLAEIRRLRPGDREVLLLAVWEGLSYEQIAGLLDVPIGTVRSRLSRARQRLRELTAAIGEDTGMGTHEEGRR